MQTFGTASIFRNQSYQLRLVAIGYHGTRTTILSLSCRLLLTCCAFCLFWIEETRKKIFSYFFFHVFPLKMFFFFPNFSQCPWHAFFSFWQCACRIQSVCQNRRNQHRRYVTTIWQCNAGKTLAVHSYTAYDRFTTCNDDDAHTYTHTHTHTHTTHNTKHTHIHTSFD